MDPEDAETGRQPLLLGVDLGTSSLKCGLFDPAGRRFGAARVAYPTSERPGRAEQSAEDWWRALVEGVRRAAAGLDPARVAGVAVGGHAPSPVFVDAELVPVAPVLAWADERARGHRDRIRDALGRPPADGPERLALEVAARAAWLRSAEPARFARAAHALLTGDYLVARLTGRPAWTDVHAREVAAAAGLPHGLFGTRQLRAGETAGAMDAGVARRLGLGSPIPVVTGGLDSFLSSVGSGIAEPGDACLGTGSSAVAALLARPPAAGRFAWRGLALLSRVLPLGGRALQWVQTASGEARPLEVLLQEAARLPSPRSAAALGSLLFAGADGVRAALAEALRDRGPVACCRLVLDALAVAQSRALARFEEEGLPVGRVRSVGRLAGCAEFAQLQADALGRAVEVPRETDSGPLGAAMLAAAALELAPPEAVPRMARVERVHRPRADSARAFEDAYGELLRPARGAPSLSRSGP